MNKVAQLGILASSLTLVSLLGACSSDNNTDPSPPVMGGANCSAGPSVALAQETGAPENQTVCGVKATDATGAELYQFFGIQYADSTAGNHRWLAPQPPQWTGIINTNQYGNRCPQGSGGTDIATDISENCLFLNVWTPKLTPTGVGDLPVMVFIHGGAFLAGSGGFEKATEPGHQNLFDGTRFVETSRQNGENIVFVTLNYRLGALGFLAGSSLGLTGNFGIQDQQKALQWVQRN